MNVQKQELMLKLKSSLIAPPAKNQSLVQVRNAEPYREFQSSEDNDRYYGMNEVLISRERRTGQMSLVAGLQLRW